MTPDEPRVRGKPTADGRPHVRGMTTGAPVPAIDHHALLVCLLQLALLLLPAVSLGQLGVLLLVCVTGMELHFGLVRRRGATVVRVSLAPRRATAAPGARHRHGRAAARLVPAAPARRVRQSRASRPAERAACAWSTSEPVRFGRTTCRSPPAVATTERMRSSAGAARRSRPSSPGPGRPRGVSPLRKPAVLLRRSPRPAHEHPRAPASRGQSRVAGGSRASSVPTAAPPAPKSPTA